MKICVYCLINRFHLIVKRSTRAWSRVIVTPGCSRRTTGWTTGRTTWRTGGTSIRTWTAVVWTRIIVIKSWWSRWAPGWSRVIIQKSGSKPGCTTSWIVTSPVVVTSPVIVIVRTIGSCSVSRVILVCQWSTSAIISSSSQTSGTVSRRDGILVRHGQSSCWHSFGIPFTISPTCSGIVLFVQARSCHGGGNCYQ